MNEDEVEAIPKDETIPVEDSTPPIKEQAESKGWECAYYDFGLADNKGIEWFNPSMVERPDGIWLLARGSEPHPQGFTFGQNDIWAFKMEKDGITPSMGKKLHWRSDIPEQQFEDARGFYHPRMNQVIISACTFCWYTWQPWTGAHQCIGMFDDEWNCDRMFYPKIGGNPGQMQKIQKHENYEKNWLFWLHDGRLHLLYKSKPWAVYAFGESWTDFTEYRNDTGASWRWGDIRGGTPPVRVGELYFTFHHSSLPWKGRYRRYYAGITAFEAKPPFRPKLITKEPILIGSQNDVWGQHKPLVVFPCGAICRDGEWLISMGVNDLKSAWLKLDHDDVMGLLRPIDEVQPIFMASGLSDGERKDGDVDVPDRDDRRTPSREVKPRQRSSRKSRRKRKFSPKALANLRANAARAREARKKNLALA